MHNRRAGRHCDYQPNETHPLKSPSLLKTGAWLACGVALAHLAFNVAAFLSANGTLSGKIAPVALVAVFAALIGILLCRRAPRGHTYLLGVVIAFYLPASRAVLWIAAFIQDLLRGQGMPGASVKAVMAVSSNSMLMLAIAVMAVFIVIAGRLAARRLE